MKFQKKEQEAASKYLNNIEKTEMVVSKIGMGMLRK